MRKVVYFVRHGQSVGNVEDLRGHESHALTERGHEQAKFVAARCARLPVEAIIASPMVRAHDTAGYIGRELGLEPNYSDLFIEAQGPSEFRNLPRNHEDGLKFDQELQENFENASWRFSDAENFHDLKTRGLAALRYLEEREEKKSSGGYPRVFYARSDCVCSFRRGTQCPGMQGFYSRFPYGKHRVVSFYLR